MAGSPVTTTVIYGFTLGLVGAVNPCGFPLLPAYLMMSAAEMDSVPLVQRAMKALGSGVAVTLGFLAVFGIIGALVEAGAGLALGWVPWVMVPVAAGLLVIGVVGAAGRLPSIHMPGLPLGRSRYKALALAGFGVTYAIASLTCSLPIFLAVVAGSFTRQGAHTGIPVSLAYALGMGLVITAVSLAGVSAQVVRLRRLRSWQPVMQRIAAGVVAVVGAYLMLYWIAYVVSPLSSPGLVRAVERVQQDLAGWLTASPRFTGVIIGAVIVTVLAAATVYGLRGERRVEATSVDRA